MRLRTAGKRSGTGKQETPLTGFSCGVLHLVIFFFLSFFKIKNMK